METETITEDRAALIRRVAAAHNLGEDWQTRMADAGDELTDDEIRQDAREHGAGRPSDPHQPDHPHRRPAER